MRNNQLLEVNLIPEWLPYAAQRLSLAANRIINHIVVEGVYTTVNGHHIIGGQISYDEFQRECHLSRSAVASGIREGVKVNLIIPAKRSNQAAFYAVPVYLPGVKEQA